MVSYTHYIFFILLYYIFFYLFILYCLIFFPTSTFCIEDDNVNVLNNAHLDSQNQLQHGAPHPQFGGITRSDLIKPISPGVGS
jgi:hypothetical protein